MTDLFECPDQNEICFLNAAGDSPPRHGGVTADCKHLLLNDIRHFTGEPLDMNIHVEHFGEHGLNPIRIHIHPLQDISSFRGRSP